VVFLILDSTDHSASSWVGPLALVAAPLALLAFATTGFQGWRRHRTSSRTSTG
jgi:hypothetical protein